MWALQAKALYYDRLNDQLSMQGFTHMTREAGESYASRMAILASGPGKLVRWEDTLSDAIRAEVEKCRREAAETIARRKERAKLGHDKQPRKFGRKRKGAPDQ